MPRAAKRISSIWIDHIMIRGINRFSIYLDLLMEAGDDLLLSYQMKRKEKLL